MNDDELELALNAAPREATPPRDPWPDLEKRIAAWPVVRWPRMALAASAVLLFGLGVGTGVIVSRPDPGVPSTTVAPDSTVFLAAARVQSTGSAHVAAVADLQRTHAAGVVQDSVALGQGYEAALAVVDAVAAAMQQAPLPELHATDLSVEARRLRHAVGLRVSNMIRNGGTQ